MPLASTSPRILAVLVGVFFLAVYLLSGSSDLLHNGDTDLRYQTTQALVDHHRLWIDHPMWLDTRVARGIGGHLYAFYGPGQAVLMIPLYIAGKVIAHHLSLPYDITTLYASRSLDLFLGAALASLFLVFCASLGYSRRVQVALTLLFGLGTVVWPDAQSALEQTQMSLFLLLATFGCWLFSRTGRRGRGNLVLAGTGVGLAIWTRYDALLYLPVFAAYIVAQHWGHAERDRILANVLWYGLAATPWIAFVALWNWLRFGSPFLTGLHEATFGHPFLQGVAELLVSPGKGLIWYLPLVFLLPWTVRQFYRRFPGLSAFFAVLCLIPLLFYANLLYWHGDPSWGPRYLYSAVPYLILPLGELFASWRSRSPGLRALAVGLIAASLVFEVAAVSVTQWRFWYRLEVLQQRSASEATWTGQPFMWGATHYQYYWNVNESPILIQLRDVYQVARIQLGDSQYRWTARPDPLVSNPADNYPINSFAFWWLDSRHPILGEHLRAVLAGSLALLAAASMALLLLSLRSATGWMHPAWDAVGRAGPAEGV